MINFEEHLVGMKEELREVYGSVFEKELIDEMIQVGSFKTVKSGFAFMDIGQRISSMPLVISGAIKVLREDDKGDELLLYFLEPGDTCAMSVTCCMGSAISEVKAIAESDVRMMFIPVEAIESWFGKYKSWRNFVLQSYHGRLGEAMDTIDRLAFLNMDERLLKYLKEKSRVLESKSINNTHQEIAYDLNTSRVVVSRLLKKLENMGKIALHRNHVEVLDL